MQLKVKKSIINAGFDFYFIDIKEYHFIQQLHIDPNAKFPNRETGDPTETDNGFTG
jgi:hypothetical protein